MRKALKSTFSKYAFGREGGGHLKEYSMYALIMLAILDDRLPGTWGSDFEICHKAQHLFCRWKERAVKTSSAMFPFRLVSPGHCCLMGNHTTFPWRQQRAV